WLSGDRDLLHRRLAERAGHFAGPRLLDSQLATLEPPQGEEDAISVDIALPTEVQVERVLEALGLRAWSAPA
ncbi:MAG: hypothetical protein KA085_19770, partial [Phenylobacterium sp.]|nr:hypothetical protein [Phenylobacterium sp.]